MICPGATEYSTTLSNPFVHAPPRLPGRLEGVQGEMGGLGGACRSFVTALIGCYLAAQPYLPHNDPESLRGQGGEGGSLSFSNLPKGAGAVESESKRQPTSV